MEEPPSKRSTMRSKSKQSISTAQNLEPAGIKDEARFNLSTSLSLKLFSEETNDELLTQALKDLPSFVEDLANTANNTPNNSIKHQIKMLSKLGILNKTSPIGPVNLTIISGKDNELKKYLKNKYNELKKCMEYAEYEEEN